MADGTDYVALPFTQDDCGAAVAGTAEERQSPAIAVRRGRWLSATVAIRWSGSPATRDCRAMYGMI
jgi:hypothetical protein